jgi:ATP/maltotriose-dependent transcriptional regulator MalT
MSTFVGRERELGWLRERAAAASAGRPQTVLVEGPVGIGKTAFLQAYTASLQPAQLLVASGDESERALALGLLHQLTGGPLLRGADPFDAGADLLALVDGRSTVAPTVLVIDDAHLADPPSLAALTFAIRRLQADKVLTVVATLEEDIARIPAGLLRLADKDGNRLRLPGLSPGEVAELSLARGHHALSARSSARLRRHTGGNPLFLQALLDEVSDADLSGVLEGLPTPLSFAHLVLGSVAALSSEAQALVRAASVVGEGTPMGLVATMAGAGEYDGALEELGRSRLTRCRRTRDAWTVAFLHPLVKAVIYEDLGPSTRATLHRRAACALHGEEALLHRVAAASGPDDELAADLVGCALQHQAHGHSHKAAELMLRAAQTHTAGAAADDLLQDAVNLFVIDGDIAAADSLHDRLADLNPTAHRLYLQAKVAWLSGRPGVAWVTATQAWSRGEELDPDRRGSLAAVLAQLCNMRGEGTDAAEWARRALALDLPPDLSDSAAAAQALGLTLAGKVQQALAGLADLPTDRQAVRTHGHRLTTRGALRLATDDVAGAREDLSRVCEVTSGELRPHRLVAMGTLAQLEFRAGRWATSLAVTKQAVSLAEDSEQVWVLGYLHAAAVLVTAARGAFDEAEHHLGEQLRLATSLADPATYALYVESRVHLAACRLESSDVVAFAAPLVALGDGPTNEPGLLGWPVHYVAALIDLGQLSDAVGALDRFSVSARERGTRSRLAALARLRGELATVERRHQTARDAFEEALTVGEGAAPALERALTHAAYGRFLRRRGEKRSAIEQLLTARTGLSELAATPFIRRCDEELAACGVSPTQPTGASDRFALTPQEQIVADLACRGLTNSQIAHQLVVSVKTVSYHLSNVYSKLDVHSRAQLALTLRAPG